MTDREFKRLSRAQLIDILYQLQVKHDELTAENEKLAKALEDKRVRIDNAGNLAEAALEITNVMQAAQDAAALYLEEIRLMQADAAESRNRMLEKAQREADLIILKAQKDANALIAQARKDADEIYAEAQCGAEELLARAKKAHPAFDSAIEAIIREYTQNN